MCEPIFRFLNRPAQSVGVFAKRGLQFGCNPVEFLKIIRRNNPRRQIDDALL
jgi:hypothetical protein